MATKQVDVEGLGTITLYKRRGTSSVRLSIANGDQVRVTLPIWAPYKVGIDFVRSKRDWILSQRRKPIVLQEGMQVGKAHRLRFVKSTGTRVTTRIKGTEVLVGLPSNVDAKDLGAQAGARRAAIKALKIEAEGLLPQRLAMLAEKHGFTYRTVHIKQMKGRWGSCNQHKDIVLNCFLMNLSWDLIDYVILHELTHTKIMAHGKPFWDEVGKYVSNLSTIRKLMRSQQPTL